MLRRVELAPAHLLQPVRHLLQSLLLTLQRRGQLRLWSGRDACARRQQLRKPKWHRLVAGGQSVSDEDSLLAKLDGKSQTKLQIIRNIFSSIVKWNSSIKYKKIKETKLQSGHRILLAASVPIFTDFQKRNERARISTALDKLNRHRAFLLVWCPSSLGAFHLSKPNYRVSAALWMKTGSKTKRALWSAASISGLFRARPPH